MNTHFSSSRRILIRLYKKILDVNKIGFRYFRLKMIYGRFKKSPEGKWIIGWKDAKKIYRLIKVSNAKNILELGTGIGASTAIMAYATAKDGKVTTLEQKESCINLAKTLIPDKLLDKISLVLSEPVAFSDKTIPGQTFSGYKNLPIESGPFDFVLIDGPSGWEEGGQIRSFPNGDIIRLIPHLKVGCLVYVDSRRKALKIYLNHLAPYLTVKSLWRTLCVLERTNVR